MALKARMKWHYKPQDYFEALFETEFDGVEISINDGEVVATLDADTYKATPDIRMKTEEHISSLLEGVRVYSHKDFMLNRGGVEVDRVDGTLNIIVSPEPARIILTGGLVEVKVTDSQGNVITDTRKERIAAKRKFADIISSKRGLEPTFDSILESYSNAVKDPDNELVHLYEIREALSVRFGNEKSAIEALGISGRDWSRLGRLANNEPLNQGRHRGKSVSQLREATAEELNQARAIAREMITSYACLLE